MYRVKCGNVTYVYTCIFLYIDLYAGMLFINIYTYVCIESYVGKSATQVGVVSK